MQLGILPSGFLVWSDKCKIPDIDPYDAEVMKYFRRQNYINCSTNEPFTYVKFNSITKRYTLNINETLKLKFGSSLFCCYQAIIRERTGYNADMGFELGKCLAFSKTVQISNNIDNILVKCNNYISKTRVYIHGHPMMPERININKRLVDAQKKNNITRAPSILMIGIDGVSRINFFRAMTKTAEKLTNNEWFEISGYNKVADNTFPNLMAILTGYKLTTVHKICNTEKSLDNCPIIWKIFQDHGYITAYAEDETWLSTFNYLKRGFELPPVDYYLRPFLLAAEKNFVIQKKSGLQFCLGYQHAVDYIYKYAFELATRYKYEPYFGLFWSNSFSHNSISDSSSMDIKVAEYLEELSTRGILYESVVIFFSDHGMRWGMARNTFSGYYEERLPFMFIWLPQWLKTKYPEFVNALRINKNRLTNPYDIHMTLKHLLELSGRTVTALPKAIDCPNCQSLLKPVPYSRSCKDIGITDHWCTCNSFQIIDTKLDLVQKMSYFIVSYLNQFIKIFKNGSISNLCDNLKIYNVIEAYQVQTTENNESYRVVLKTMPGDGLFEATVRHNKQNNKFRIIGTISRLNSYGSDSKCVNDSNARLYCYCLKKPKYITNISTTEFISIIQRNPLRKYRKRVNVFTKAKNRDFEVYKKETKKSKKT